MYSMRTSLAVTSYLLVAVADAKALKWSEDRQALAWAPAHQTIGAVGAAAQEGPAPTSAPELKERGNHRRGTDDNTCAYLSGLQSVPLGCSTNSLCVYNSLVSAIGCCPDTSSKCPVFTTCLDSTQSSLYTTNNGWTLWCMSSKFPNCVTHTYGPNDPYGGYTFLDCAVAKETDIVYFSPTDTTSSTRRTTTPGSVSSSPSSRSSSTTSTIVSPSTDPSTTPTAASSGSSTPIGAIVGGAVGGVAALGLIGLGAFFLIRQSKKDKAGRDHPPPPATGPQGQHHMSMSQPPGDQHDFNTPPPQMGQYQQGGYPPQGYPAAEVAGYAAADNRNSMAKMPYNVTHSVYDPSIPTASPPQSPPPPQSPMPFGPGQVDAHQQQWQGQGQQSGSMYGQPSPTSAGGGGVYAPPGQPSPPPGHQQAHYPGQPQYHQAHELPTQRGDGQLNELA